MWRNADVGEEHEAETLLRCYVHCYDYPHFKREEWTPLKTGCSDNFKFQKRNDHLAGIFISFSFVWLALSTLIMNESITNSLLQFRLNKLKLGLLFSISLAHRRLHLIIKLMSAGAGRLSSFPILYVTHTPPASYQ